MIKLKIRKRIRLCCANGYKTEVIIKNAQKIREKNVKLAEISKNYCNPLV